MHTSFPDSSDDIESILDQYGDMLYRLCLILLKNPSDAEDILQETLIKYVQKSPRFENAAHQKAWLIKVALNHCRDLLRFRKRHPQIITEPLSTLTDTTADSGILDALAALPEAYRLVLTLYYVEEYPVKDIARIINRTPSAVKMRLLKGRKLLKEQYDKECIKWNSNY